jgi:hypothetical protein
MGNGRGGGPEFLFTSPPKIGADIQRSARASYAAILRSMGEWTNFRPESFVPVLERIRDILLEHDFVSQGTHAAELIDLAHLESEEFVRLVQIGRVWGSAGSIADSIGLNKSLDPVDAETERDSVELTRALIQLADQMREQGIESEGSEFIAKLFRRGLQQRGIPEDESP